MKRKRHVYWLEWRRGAWVLRRGRLALVFRTSKAEAVRMAARRLRTRWEIFGELGQLKVRNKNGRIAFERTFGADPRRHRG